MLRGRVPWFAKALHRKKTETPCQIGGRPFLVGAQGRKKPVLGSRSSMASPRPYFFFRVAFFLVAFFLATFFFFGAAFFLATFFLATFFLAAFFLATFFLATFFLATFFLATFFLAAFFLVAFFLATLRPPNKVAGELLADCRAGGRKSADRSPQKQDNESLYLSSRQPSSVAKSRGLGRSEAKE